MSTSIKDPVASGSSLGCASAEVEVESIASVKLAMQTSVCFEEVVMGQGAVLIEGHSALSV
jgi:hypothetical protein